MSTISSKDNILPFPGSLVIIKYEFLPLWSYPISLLFGDLLKYLFPWKQLLLSVVFGILLIWMDFNDVSPVSDSVGNLDQILGHQLWHPTEVFLPLVSIVVFFLLGRHFVSVGKAESADSRSSVSVVKPLALFVVYLVLLILVDIDDILKVLNIPSNLQLSSQSPGYWLLMEAVYPIASMVVFIAFGKMCFEYGRSRQPS